VSRPRRPTHRLPLVGRTQLGDSGIGVVQAISTRAQRLGGLGFSFSQRINADYGVDGLLEIVDQAGHATGKLLGVQVKTGDSFFRRGVAGGGVVYVAKSTMRYWREYSVPVILVLCDEKGEQALWVRVDRGDFRETGKGFRITVPGGQRYDVSAVPALSELAPEAPRRLLAQAILSPELMAEDLEVQEALRVAGTDAARRKAAQRAITFAEVLHERGRAHEAISLVQRAVRALHSSGEMERAIIALCDLVEWVLDELRDGYSAHQAIAFALTPDTPRAGEIGLPEWPHPLRVRLEILRARAEAMCGVNKSALEAAGRLRQLAGLSKRGRDRTIRKALDLELLSALAAEDHLGAADANEALADLVKSDDEHTKCLLYAMLHRGLGNDPRAYVEPARKLGVPEGAVLTRYMVLGWLRAESRDFLAARQDFIDAGGWALDHHDTESAHQSFRNAAAMERQAGVLPLGPDSPAMRAHYLEPLVRAHTPRRATHTSLMGEADSDISRRQWRVAAINLNMALVRAYQDGNWLAVQEVRLKGAEMSRGAAADTPTPDTLIPAARETAITLMALGKEEQGAVLDDLKALLGSRMVPAFADKVWDALMDGTQQSEGVIGAIKIATSLGKVWKLGDDRDERLSALITRGIELGWSGIGNDSGISSACELVLALRPPLKGAHAAGVCEALTQSLAGARWMHLPDLLNAIAVTAAEATAPSDGGTEIVERLLAAEAEANQHGASPQWVGALAMNSLRMTGSAKERAVAALAARADAAPQGGGPEWQAVERAIVAGIDVGPEMGDRYLTAMADLLDALAAQTRSGGLGGGVRDITGLTQWASTNSSAPVRERAVRAAIRFLLLDGHLLHERRSWIPFIGRLAQHTPTSLPEAVAALERVARGELLPRGGPFDEFTSPFAFFKVTGHTLTALREAGLSWLGTLIPVVGAEGSDRVIEVLEAAIEDPEPEIRSMAATVARWAIDEPGVSEHTRAQLGRRIIQPASNDHVERVAIAALRNPPRWDED
jgi:hypothetical protein